MRKFDFQHFASNECFVHRPGEETKIQAQKALDSICSLVAKPVDN
jgi:hypothetical protein